LSAEVGRDAARFPHRVADGTMSADPFVVGPGVLGNGPVGDRSRGSALW
jgi:hypothetical protein